jgi:hypothetical protein
MRGFLDHRSAQESSMLETEAKAEAERLGVAYQPPKLTEQLDFSVPDGVEPFWIWKASGARAEPGASGAFLEYFVKGTEPEEHPPVSSYEGEATTSSYLESPDL